MCAYYSRRAATSKSDRTVEACRESFSSDATSTAPEKIAECPDIPGLPGRTGAEVVAVISTRGNKKTTSNDNHVDVTYLLDCQNLAAMDLRRKYASEANSHRNMKQRLKRNKIAVHPELRKFRDFLRHVGPKPTNGASVDRVDNSDPEYAPGKIAWADRRTQNSNKGDSLLFRDPETHDVFTTSQLAKRHGVRPSTIRKWKERGWTDAEIIAGYRFGRSSRGADAPAGRSTRDRRVLHSATDEIEGTWKEAFKGRFPTYHVLDFTGKERSLMSNFAERCPPDVQAPAIVSECVRRWDEFCFMAKTDQGAYGLPEKPTIEFLHRYAQTAVNFAARVQRDELKNLNYSDPPPQKPVKIIRAKPRPESREDERKPTLDEVLAIINGDYVDEDDPYQ